MIPGRRGNRLAGAVLVGIAWLAVPACQSPPRVEPGRALLRIVVVDGGRPTSARLRVVRGDGAESIAPDAVALIGDCTDRVDIQTPVAVAEGARRDFREAATGRSTHFYVDGQANLTLAPGSYTVTASRGLEFREVVHDIELVAGERRELRVEVPRWIDLPAEGWYSADGHLHVPRPDPSRDADLAAWLRAENVHVGNLLQWGNAAAFANDFQYAMGREGTVVDGETILLPGQEYPRTHFFGHSMFLGVSARIEPAADYLDYRNAFIAARGAGGLTGIGHSGEWGGDLAAAVLLADNLIDFIEVFAFRTPNYELWYEALDAGFRVAPTAGTDYPCGAGGVPPGTPRFYARVDGPLTPESWVAAVRADRTFVTNGPVLRLSVAGRGMGEELVLEQRSSVPLKAAVLFDPERDSVRAVEVVRNSEVIETHTAPTAPGRFDLDTMVPIEEASWLAIRTFGSRLRAEGPWRNGFAHSAPVWVRVAGRPPLSASRRARARIATWMRRLDTLEAQLGDEDRRGELELSGGSDGITATALAASRLVLIWQVQQARVAWQRRLGA